MAVGHREPTKERKVRKTTSSRMASTLGFMEGVAKSVASRVGEEDADFGIRGPSYI